MFAPQVLLLRTHHTGDGAAQQPVAASSAPAATPMLNNLVVIAVLLARAPLWPRARRWPPSATTPSRPPPARPRHYRGRRRAGGRAVAVAAAGRRPSAAGVGSRATKRCGRCSRLSGWTFGYVVANQVAFWVVLVLANGQGAATCPRTRPPTSSSSCPTRVRGLGDDRALARPVRDAGRPRPRRLSANSSRSGCGMTALVLLPAAAGYAMLARPIVATVLSTRRRCTRPRPRRRRTCSPCFALGLPAFSAYLLLMRGYQRCRTPAQCSSSLSRERVEHASDLALYPAFGVQGLALGFACAYVGGAVVVCSSVAPPAGGLDGRGCGASVGRIAVATAVMAAPWSGPPRAVWRTRAATRARPGRGGCGVPVLRSTPDARALGVRELDVLVRARRSGIRDHRATSAGWRGRASRSRWPSRPVELRITCGRPGDSLDGTAREAAEDGRGTSVGCHDQQPGIRQAADRALKDANGGGRRSTSSTSTGTRAHRHRVGKRRSPTC